MRAFSLVRYPLAVLAVGLVAVACSGSEPAGFGSGGGGGGGGGAGGSADAGDPNGGGGGGGGVIVVGPTPEEDAGRIGADAGCAGVKSEGKRSPVYMLIVLDGSGSMSGTKWTAASQAMGQFFTQVQTSNDQSFGLGLTVFEDSKSGQFGGNNVIQVPIRFVDAAQASSLATRMATSPSGLTPSLSTLTAAYANLASYAPAAPLQPGGKKVLVFISDGEPSSSGGRTTAQEKTAVEDLVRRQANLTPTEFVLTTFSVGVGPLNTTSGYDPRFMGRVAVAGGTAKPNCDVNNISDPARMCHFQLTPGSSATQLATEFLAAINTIRGLAASCEYSFTVPAGERLDPNLVSVSFTENGTATEVPKSSTDGWRYDNPSQPTKVILVGGWCDRVRNASEGKVEVVLGCAPKVN
jgi:hypothetical protein